MENKNNELNSEATAEVFYRAFSSLKENEKELFLQKLLKNDELKEDLIDVIIAESRKDEESEDFDEFIKKLSNG